MESFKVKILQSRRSLGIKAISARSIEEAESFLLQLIYDFFDASTDQSSKYYFVKREGERKLKLVTGEHRISLQLTKV